MLSLLLSAFWPLFSWVFWLTWMAVGATYEVFAVIEEKRNGALPLTRVVRDRLMRKSTLVKFGVLLFLTWIWIHFILKFTW